jgi:hypothetical protein
MGGIFSKANRPKLPGAYFNFEAKEVPVLPASPGATVALVTEHDWGPFQEPVRSNSFAEWQAVFGASDDTPAYRAARQIFEGEGLSGRGGAGELLTYRTGTGSAAPASRALSNGTTTALTVQARYNGTRGDDLRITVRDAATAGNDELLVYDGTTLLETFEYLQTDIDDLGAQITADSDWIEVDGAITSGTALAAITSQALSGGNDGGPLTGTEYTAAFSALEVEPFGVFVAADLDDASGGAAIQASIQAWADEQAAAGHAFIAVVGGQAGETAATAIARSATLASPNVVNVGIGTVRDLDLASGGESYDLGGGALAPRVAGILAARGEYASITMARLAGVELIAGPDTSDLEDAFDGGVVAFGRDSHTTAPVHVKTGLSTWTADAATVDKPYLIYRQPKFVRTMHGISTDLTRWAEENIIGIRPINEATKTALIGEVKTRLLERERLGAIQPGWTVSIDNDPPPTAEDEFIALVIGVKFARPLEQVYFTVAVS